jgi:hypothetical protein
VQCTLEEEAKTKDKHKSVLSCHLDTQRDVLFQKNGFIDIKGSMEKAQNEQEKAVIEPFRMGNC